MASKWPEVTVGDIADTRKNALVGGPFGSNLVSKDYVEEGVPVIRGQNMGSRHIGGDFVFVTEKKAQALAANTARPGDLVFTQRGTLGQVALVPHGLYDTYIVSQSQMKLTADPLKADPLFLYYIFSSPEQLAYIDAHAIKVGVPHTNLGILRNTPVILPPLAEQRRIVEILGTLDDKIELNRQLGTTLEQLARGFFQSWFVDFDPVRAKASGEPEESICRRLGLTPEILTLFPAALEDSKMGEMPVGWEVKSLPEAVTVNPSRTIAKAVPTPYLDMANVPAHSARVNNVITRTFSSGSKFINGDTLLARITPCLENGKTAYVDFLEENQVGWGSTEFIVMRPKTPLPTEFGYLLARHPAFRNFAIANMEGTSGRQRVPNNCFVKYFLAIPPKEVAVQFGNLVKPLMHQIKLQDEESRTLAALRDELLPKLLSGDIRLN